MVLAYMGRGDTGRDRLMRYITIVALAFAFAGSAHGATNDLKAARKGGEDDTARKAAERPAQGIAKPEIYWLDTAYRPSDGELIHDQSHFLGNKSDRRILHSLYTLSACKADAQFRL